ncbi:MAG: response regulator transcription factor [Bacteroidota bacterium]
MTQKIILGIFDDHPFFIEGLKGFLQKHDVISIEFTASTKIELEQKLSDTKAEILIMDVLAPDVTGLELYFYTVKKYPALKIIAYTSLKSDILIESLLELGVKGYVNKNQSPEDLFDAIKDVYYDLISVPAEYEDLIPKTTSIKSIFTPRESDITQLIAQGKTSDIIAKELEVSLRTIENIKLNLFKKLEVKNAAELILVATRLGYIS